MSSDEGTSGKLRLKPRVETEAALHDFEQDNGADPTKVMYFGSLGSDRRILPDPAINMKGQINIDGV